MGLHMSSRGTSGLSNLDTFDAVSCCYSDLKKLGHTHTHTHTHTHIDLQRRTTQTGANRLTHLHKHILTPPAMCSLPVLH